MGKFWIDTKSMGLRYPNRREVLRSESVCHIRYYTLCNSCTCLMRLQNGTYIDVASLSQRFGDWPNVQITVWAQTQTQSESVPLPPAIYNLVTEHVLQVEKEQVEAVEQEAEFAQIGSVVALIRKDCFRNSFVPECLEKRLPASDLSLHPVFFTEEPRFQRVISGFVFQNYPWVGLRVAVPYSNLDDPRTK